MLTITKKLPLTLRYFFSTATLLMVLMAITGCINSGVKTNKKTTNDDLTGVDPSNIAVRFAILNTANVTAGNTMTIRVEAQNSFGQVVTQFQENVILNMTGELTGAQPVNITNGRGTVIIMSPTPGTVLLSLIDSYSTGLDVSGVRQVLFLPNITEVDHISFLTLPTSAEVGQDIPPFSVKVFDSNGTGITDQVDVSIQIGDNAGTNGTLSGTVTRSTINGVATFDNLKINEAGTGYTFIAWLPSMNSINDVESPEFNITETVILPGTGSIEFLVQPTNAEAWDTMSTFSVRVLDSNGNAVTNQVAVKIEIGNNAGPGGMLAGTLTRNSVNGIATFNNLEISKAGIGYTFIASVPTDSNLPSKTSNTFNITEIVLPPTGPASMEFLIQPSNAEASETMNTFSVRVLDSSGNAITNQVDVVMSIGNNAGPNGFLVGTLTRTTVNGIATFNNVIITAAGVGYTLIASVGTIPTIESNNFNVSEPVIIPGSLEFLTQPSNTEVGEHNIAPVRVRVLDGNGNVVTTEVYVGMQIGRNAGPDGFLAGTIMIRTINGIATFSNLRISKIGTGYTLIASVSGVPQKESNRFDVTDSSLPPTDHQEIFGAGNANGRFGGSISVSGDLAIIGADGENNGAGNSSGSAYIYRRSGSQWVHEQRLTPNVGTIYGGFGSSVGISGSSAIVMTGNPSSNNSSADVYIFRYNTANSSWVQSQKLIPDNQDAFKYGRSVAIDGNIAVVGSSGPGGAGYYIYIYRQNGWLSWVLEKTFSYERGSLGSSLSVSNNTIIAGAYSTNINGASHTGAAYIYRYNGSNWVLDQQLLASDHQAGDTFGESVSISGDVAIVGGVTNNAENTYPGKAYIFRYNGSNWVEEIKIDGSQTGLSGVASSVSISGNVAVIGSYSGAYVYKYNGSSWAEDRLIEPVNENPSYFGRTVAMSGDHILIGDLYFGPCAGSVTSFYP